VPTLLGLLPNLPGLQQQAAACSALLPGTTAKGSVYLPRVRELSAMVRHIEGARAVMWPLVIAALVLVALWVNRAVDNAR
jgi:hypothetical protein